MEGLINGLMDVALGRGHHNDNDDHNSRQDDQRSRSTWAGVVSGDQTDDHDDDNNTHRRPTRNQNQSNNRHSQEDNSSGYGNSSGTDGQRPSRRQYKEDTEASNDGWETVGKKPPRQSHKIQKDNWNGYKRPANEQQYGDEVDTGCNMEPSQGELSDLSEACNKLWELDLNRLVPGNDYEIDCGEGKKVYQKRDMAEGNLFSWVNEDIFKKPTYARFFSLLDNYNPNQGVKEVVTNEEKQEQAAFIEEISRTAPIKYLYKYLCKKGVISESYQEFKQSLNSFWFDLYSRGGTYGSSSAFEHVFVGEIKQRGEQEVSGFHNWLQFYLEEAKGNVDYQGYIFPRRRGSIPDTETQVLTIQFEWNGVLKSVSSTLVGVSPEFEVALYTLCFYAGGEDNFVQLGPYSVNIKCYRLRDKIGSAFPVAES
ncbi:hypothetical protein ACFE04_013854 [Oxalis oulophora]